MVVDALTREVLIRAAILAPSMHNAQPWLFRFDGQLLEVYRDPRRELGAEDSDGRMTLMGVGAAIFNLRVAAAALGRTTTTCLLPDPRTPTLAAKIRLEQRGTDTGEMREIAGFFRFLACRRVNRNPFSGRAVPPRTRQELERAALAEGATLEWIERADRVRWLRHLAASADFSEADQPERLLERRSWVGGVRTSEGVPSVSLGPRPVDPPAAVRDLAVDPTDQVRETAEFERSPVLAVLATKRDTPRDRLVAGQALQRVLLTATVRKMAVSLLNQPIEHEDLRWLVRDPLTGWSEPQTILRLGYGPGAPATPRRPVSEFMLEPVAASKGEPTDADT